MTEVLSPPLDRMLEARRLLQGHLDCIIRQIRTRAGRRTISRRRRCRQLGRDTWSPGDERTYQAEIEALSFARSGEIDALTTKLERHDRAIEITTRRMSHGHDHD